MQVEFEHTSPYNHGTLPFYWLLSMLSKATKEPSTLRLADVAKVDPSITALWLYGSRARGDHHPHSDYDLAVRFTDRESNPLSATEKLNDLTLQWRTQTNLDISLVDINNCPTPLAAVISEEGLLLVDKLPHLTPWLYQQLWSKWEDWQYIRQD